MSHRPIQSCPPLAVDKLITLGVISRGRGGMQVASAPLELFLLLAYAGRARGELDLIALRGGGGRCHGLVLFRLSNFAIASYLAFGHLILLGFRLIVGCRISMLRHDRAFVSTQQGRNVPPRRQESLGPRAAELNRLIRSAAVVSPLQIC